MIEQEVVIDSQGIKLSGTICLPDNNTPYPFVLMVHGSGPLDRNENAFFSHKLNVFNTIAHRLAEQGVASLRYDKRGCGKSEGNYYTATHSDLVDDAVACVDYLSQFDFCISNKIYVLGHSEGSIIAPQAGIKRPCIDGIILLCPFAQAMDTILMSQARYAQDSIDRLTGLKKLILSLVTKLTGNQITAQRKLIDRLKSTTTTTIRHWFVKIPANWLRELLNLDAQAIFQKVTCRVLLIGGEKDIQCDPADVDLIANLVPGQTEAHIIKDMTHILRLDKQEPSFFNYSEQLKKPIDPTVINLVLRWLKQRSNNY